MSLLPDWPPASGAEARSGRPWATALTALLARRVQVFGRRDARFEPSIASKVLPLALDRPVDRDADVIPVHAREHAAPPALKPAWTRDVVTVPFTPDRLRLAKRAFTTRRVPFEDFYDRANGLLLTSGPVRPRSGDVVLAQVERIGQHARIEFPDGRRSRMHVGDEILVVYGDRYAPDQFEAQVPADLGPTSLVASGGVAATVLSRSGSVGRATDIIPIGLVTDSLGAPLNLSRFGLTVDEPVVTRPRTIAVIGTSMNSGKTTSMQSLILGLKAAGEIVGATKVTGTGSGADYWVMVDAGASCVVDFTDVGLVSTYRVPFAAVEANMALLVDHLTNAGCTAIVIEVADGIYQQETALLLRSTVFRSYVDTVIFAAADAVGAVAGTQHLEALGLPVVAATGMLTRSPLAHREAEHGCSVPVFTRNELAEATIASELLWDKYRASEAGADAQVLHLVPNTGTA